MQRFDEPACVIVKHANPCGVAVAADIATAYQRANACDPVSAFGGIVAVNRPVPARRGQALAPVFTEVVVAPGYDDDALATLTAKTNLRVLSRRAARPPVLDVRPVDGGLLVQEPDPVTIDRSAWWVVTGDPADRRSSGTTWSSPGRSAPRSARTPSSSPRTARRSASAPVSRTASTRPASPPTGRATGPSAGVCASDAFFPFHDGLDVAAAAGITAVIQPGGSIRDAEVIEAADEHGIAMVFTGERHFRH